MLPLTKTDYLLFLACPPELWYSKHQPGEAEVALSEEDLHIINQGHAIEQLAREYFARQDAVLVEYQKVFQTAELYAKADFVLTEPGTESRTIIEVKSSTQVKDEFIDDLAFQCIVAEDSGFRPKKAALLLVNNQYVKNGSLNPAGFFTYWDVTEAVAERIPYTREQITRALAYLVGDAPRMLLHEFCGNKCDCPVLRMQFSNLPEYTVFDINRIGQAKLRELLQNGIISITDVPGDFKLSDKQWAQVQVAREGKPRIDKAAIHKHLSVLEYPLYFLDYESLQYGIPLFDGVKPYQQMVFQWSLHILDAPDGALYHREYLADGTSLPTWDFAATLQASIPASGGTVVVWNKSFETTRNKELGEMHPEVATFMASLNNRVFDLMEIFQQQLYLHPSAKGSYSIKQILPILAPELSYDDLEINHGMLAAIRWFQLATGKISEHYKAATLENMRKYCHLDTLAMVEIYKQLILNCQ